MDREHEVAVAERSRSSWPLLTWGGRGFIGLIFVVITAGGLVVVSGHRHDLRIGEEIQQAGGKVMIGYAGPTSLYSMIAHRTNLLDRVLSVHLSGKVISHETCRDIASLRSLRTLSLNHSTFEVEDLELLVSSSELQVLELVRTNLNDETLACLGKSSALKNLDIRNNAVGDGGVNHLLKLPQLSSLSLGGTAVTDESVRRLKDVRSLRYVNLSSTATTEQARSELRAALPKCKTWPDP